MAESTGGRGRPNTIGVRTGLGPLEAQVIRAVAEIGGWVRVREVCDALSKRGYFAYQGVLNCMNRLVRKGLLDRAQEAGAYSFRLRVDPEEITARVVTDALKHLAGDRDRVLCRVLDIDPDLGAPELARLRQRARRASSRRESSD